VPRHASSPESVTVATSVPTSSNHTLHVSRIEVDLLLCLRQYPLSIYILRAPFLTDTKVGKGPIFKFASSESSNFSIPSGLIHVDTLLEIEPWGPILFDLESRLKNGDALWIRNTSHIANLHPFSTTTLEILPYTISMLHWNPKSTISLLHAALAGRETFSSQEHPA
jgi:hypothetical protein